MSRSPRHLKPASPAPAASVKLDQSAFTLVELMVACAVMAVMLILISVTIGQVGKGVKTSTEKVDAFQSARAGFETVTRALSVATLNTYWDYYILTNNTYQSRGSFTNPPQFYGRQSDLHFLVTNLGAPTTFGGFSSNSTVTHGVFFQAPLGYSTNTNSITPPGALNGCGFFVAFGNDPTRPGITGLTNRPRFRLYQWLQSSEELREVSDTGKIDPAWINPSTNNGARPLAENIIAFVVRVPGTNATVTSTNATNYFWNSGTTWTNTMTNQPPQMHQLPPLVEITMVAVDEAAANRLLVGTATNDAVRAANALMTGVFLGANAYRSLFTNNANYSADLKRVTDGLNGRRVPYRVFTTTIPLRSSRWSP